MPTNDSTIGASPSLSQWLARLWRHFAMTRWHFSRAFSEPTLRAIQNAVAEAERSHGGEIRFVVERELSTGELLRNVSPRQRAVELFGQLGVWDTEANNGVLIYVLLADRDVEIVADRGYSHKVAAEEWTAVCTTIEAAFQKRDYRAGATHGIAAASALMRRSFPTPDGNELPDMPVVL
jgi:uncharacterized membrane protein